MSGNKVTQQLVVQSQPIMNQNLFPVDTAFFTPSGQNIQPGIIPVTTSTAAGTVAKTTTTPEPPAGSTIALIFTQGNSAVATLSFNGGTARVIQCGGAVTTAAKLTIGSNGVAFMYFDGTILHQSGAVTSV